MKAMTFSTLIWFILTELLAFSGGAGTSESPWQVATKADLNDIRNYLNQDKYFEQTADITFETADFQSGGTYYNSGALWLPIGSDINNSFTGKYDGKGKKITGLRINRPSTNNVGLFGHFGNNSATSSIKDVHLEDVIVAGARGVGTLIGRVTGQQNTITEKCSAVNGSVTGNAATGGLVGSNNSFETNLSNAESKRPRIINSYANINVYFSGVSDEANGNIKFGGLTGCNQKGHISNCYALGNVTANKMGSVIPSRVGGLSGCIYLRGYVEKSYSAGAVSGTDATDVGGLVGYLGSGDVGSQLSCFWDTETSNQLTSPYGTGKSNADMKTQATFTDWDFTTTWEIIGTNYPRLKANPDQTLPVTLTSFTAVYTASNAVNIQWITQSESNMIGYHVLRAEDNNITNALRVSDYFIQAVNISTEHSYSFSDQTIGANQEYYYWLQSADMSGTIEYYGPIYIKTTEIVVVPPYIPLTTHLKSAYPNPFNPSTSISFELATPENIEINIYNVKGQFIRNICNNAFDKGTHSIVWDGKDSYGLNCGTGVYFYKMQTNDQYFVKKMMLIK